ncbi:MAG: DapH/DapD/GlmU-related protein [Bacteroidota bacterium]
MRKLISRFILKCINKQDLLDVIAREEAKRNAQTTKIAETSVTLGTNSKLYAESKVHNIQNDPNKIIVGNNTHIRGELLLFKYGGSISIGDNCYIGEGSRIWSGDEVTIGNNVLISHNVNVIDTNSHELDFKERSNRYKDLIANGHWNEKGNIDTAPIYIDDDVWISFGAIILKGMSIGRGSIVAAGAVVTENVPEFVVVAGNPAKVVKKLVHVE